MSLITRFSCIDKAMLVSTGNSLVVCGNASNLSNNTSDMITLSGTATRNWTLSGSSANLNILANSDILYAELSWYSTVNANISSAPDLRSTQDSPITFNTPTGVINVSPQYTESFTDTNNYVDRFRSAVVTDIIKTSLSGEYSVSNVPTSVPTTGISASRSGWVLSVVYRNNLFKPKKVVFYSGIGNVNQAAPLQTTITGFTTSNTPSELSGNLFIAAANGKPIDTGSAETVKVGSSFANLVTLGNIVGAPSPNPGTVPNNPNNNFFAGQINICDPTNINNGLININGTNGSKNNDGFVPSQIIGTRNKWDLTNVSIAPSLTTAQNQLAIQISQNSGLDGIMIVGMGSSVSAIAPDVSISFDAFDSDGRSADAIRVGEQLVYSLQIKNKGNQTASNVTFSVPLDASCSYIPDSLKINGTAIPGANIITGVNAGAIDPNGVSNIIFTVRVNSLPPSKQIQAITNGHYEFVSSPQNIINYWSTPPETIYISDSSLAVVKTASTANASVGDTVTYTVNINNTGTTIATNVMFQDLINPYSSFVNGSVKVNGVSEPTYNPINGFSLLDLNITETATVSFDAIINQLPPSTIVNNYAKVSFAIKTPSGQVIYTLTTFSNNVPIQIMYTDIVALKCTDNDYPNVGDTVTYNLKLTNIGNETATDVQVLEPPVFGASFVTGTVTINGVPKPSYNPFTGFTIPSIAPQQSVIVAYQMLTNSVDPDRLVQNTANVPFKYQISQGSPVISDQQQSNKVTTLTSFVAVNMLETVDKAYATINDTLYYTVNITNNGNIDAINTNFLSYIDPSSSFIPDSVSINGVPQPGFNPNLGFSIGTLCTNNTVIVTYQATVTSLPSPNVIYNNSELIYGYKPDPNGQTVNSTATSNTVQTTINKLDFSVIKDVDKAYAQVGDNLNYTITISNTGTVALTNVKFFDFLSTYVTLNPNGVYVNEVPIPDANLMTGVLVGDIHPGDIVRVFISTVINAVPPAGFILDTANIMYTYQLNPTSEIITTTRSSNEVSTAVINGKLTLLKSVNKAYSTLNDTLTYSVSITNTGNVTTSNIDFFDIIPTGATFVNGSVVINGLSKPLYNPNTGFPIGNLTQGQVTTVSFDALVTSIPVPNTLINSSSANFEYVLVPNTAPITSSATSNSVTTIINNAAVSLVKTVDKNFATIGDTLNYTVVSNNTGTIDVFNCIFKDIIPTGATFVTDSVLIDGVSKPGYDPNIGFASNNINAGGFVTVSFQATVTAIPNPNTIINSASLDYKYKIDPTGPSYSGSATSNTVTTTVLQSTVTILKSANKSYVTVGDTLTYTSVVSNTGNTPITNIVFQDLIPPQTSFNTGSVKINSTTYGNYNPITGFPIGNLNPGASVTVVFDVTINTFPAPGYITNNSTVDYYYKIDPSGETFLGNATSNTVITNIKVGSLNITKTPNRDFARISDVVVYDFVISNTGNTLLQNIIFKDIVQSQSTFNANSVKINGVTTPGADPNTGFQLSNIAIGSLTTVQFSVTVNSIPPNNVLLNTATVDFSYYIDPNGTIINSSKTSNQTTVNVNDTIILATKGVDKTVARVGNELTYTIDINNDGNIPANNVLFKDILDSNISFVPESVIINGTPSPSSDPQIGFSIPDILAGATDTVIFKALINTRPSNNKIPNFATINYQYTPDPQKPPVDVQINSNTVITDVAYGELTATKSSDKTYYDIGSVVNYTVSIKNTGSINAFSQTFKDILQTGLSFLQGSVLINGVSYSSYNPNTGFAIPDLVPNATTTVSFSATVVSLPSSGKIDNNASITFSYDSPVVTTTTTSNTVTIFVNTGILTILKAVDLAYATINDNLVYSFTLKNDGSATCSNILFNDIVQSQASFNTGSVIVNGTSQPTYNPNNGFTISDIQPGDTSTVSFSVKVNSLPTNNYIYNHSTAAYSYYVNPTEPLINKSIDSNTVSTKINKGSLTAVKTVNLAYATIGDTIIYTVNVTNTGNVDNTNINFRDVIPSGLTFVQDSVTINGVSQPGLNPYQSFSLGTIISGDAKIVQFRATVTSIPNPAFISNTANITYTYRINPAGPDIIAQVDSNTATTQLIQGQLSITKAVDKSYATANDVLTYSFVVTNVGNVDTTNVFFSDTLQSDILFNTGSVIINGTTYPSYDPTVGFSIGNLATLGAATLSFTVTIIPNPSQYQITNTGSVNYNYKISPSGQDFNKTTNSNTVTTNIKIGQLSAIKSVDLAYATINDILNYTITVTNVKNAEITNLTLLDTLSSGATFIAGSVIINNVSYPSYDPIVGISLPDLVGGNAAIVKFSATVTSVPNPSQVTNNALINGLYKVDPSVNPIAVSTTSNTVSTEIRVGNISIAKTVDKLYAKVLDTLIYTSVITNTGNITATSVKFLDNLQPDISFIDGTLRINGVVYPLLDPTQPIDLGNLNAGQTVTVDFDVIINTLPTNSIVQNTSQAEFNYKINPNGSTITQTNYSNTVSTNVVLGQVTVNKSVDKPIATIGDTLTFTITLNNSGNVLASSLMFYDTPSQGALFNSGSVIINGISQPTYNPTVGFAIDDIPVGSVVTVSFSATVVSLPINNVITNQATVSFKYLVNPKEPPLSKTTYSNTTTTNISLGQLSVVKTVNKAYATIGDELTYTIVITNVGNIEVTNVVFLDPTPANSNFVLGSVIVNGTSHPTYNPSVGFLLESMLPGETITVSYKVVVIS